MLSEVEYVQRQDGTRYSTVAPRVTSEKRIISPYNEFYAGRTGTAGQGRISTYFDIRGDGTGTDIDHTRGDGTQRDIYLPGYPWERNRDGYQPTMISAVTEFLTDITLLEFRGDGYHSTFRLQGTEIETDIAAAFSLGDGTRYRYHPVQLP